MHLNETRYWPVAKAALALLGCAALVLLAVCVLIPAFKNRVVPAAAPGEPAPRQTVQPPQAGPDLSLSAAESLQGAVPQTVLLAAAAGVEALADPFVFGREILFAAGADTAHLTRLVRVDPVTGAVTELAAERVHDALRNPCEDEAYAVYFDAKAAGGGTVRALNKQTGEISAVCAVASGMPRLYLESPYLAFCERVSADAARLCVWNLSTGENVALAMFTDPAYASSAPCIDGGAVYFVDAAGDGGGLSVIRSVRLSDGAASEYAPNTYVHSPQAGGEEIAWLTGNRGDDSDLYLRKDGDAVRIARGVVDFALASGYLAYSRDETVFACALENGRTHVLSAAGSSAQLAAAGEGLILWRDLTDTDRPLWKYILIG